MASGIVDEIQTESDGALLNRMLAGHNLFLESVFRLMRFVEGEVSRHGLALIRNGGYAITRNGWSANLGGFSDWSATHMGIAFVSPKATASVQGVTHTAIPREGLDILGFQVRWLGKSPKEPVAWYFRLRVEPEGSQDAKKWEEYQTGVFAKLEPERRSKGVTTGDLKPGKLARAGRSIVYTGRFGEVPVTQLQSQSDVVTQLVAPAIAL